MSSSIRISSLYTGITNEIISDNHQVWDFFLYEKYTNPNAIIKNAGNIAIKRKVPAPEPDKSINLPITGKTMATDKNPSPPIKESPRAPLSGIFSEMNPIMVGQK